MNLVSTRDCRIKSGSTDRNQTNRIFHTRLPQYPSDVLAKCSKQVSAQVRKKWIFRTQFALSSFLII